MLKFSKKIFIHSFIHSFHRITTPDKARNSKQRGKVAFFPLADVITATHEYQEEIVTTTSIIRRGNCNFCKAQSYFRRIFLMLGSVKDGSYSPGSKCHLEGGAGEGPFFNIHPSILAHTSSALSLPWFFDS